MNLYRALPTNCPDYDRRPAAQIDNGECGVYSIADIRSIMATMNPEIEVEEYGTMVLLHNPDNPGLWSVAAVATGHTTP